MADYTEAGNKAITKDDITKAKAASIAESVFSKVSEVDLIDVIY